MRNKKILFLDFFSEKYRKMSKKLKMGQILIKKVKIDEKCKKQYFFSIFSEKYRKMSKKLKMGQILMKKVKIDEKRQK